MRVADFGLHVPRAVCGKERVQTFVRVVTHGKRRGKLRGFAVDGELPPAHVDAFRRGKIEGKFTLHCGQHIQQFRRRAHLEGTQQNSLRRGPQRGSHRGEVFDRLFGKLFGERKNVDVAVALDVNAAEESFAKVDQHIGKRPLGTALRVFVVRYVEPVEKTEIEYLQLGVPDVLVGHDVDIRCGIVAQNGEQHVVVARQSHGKHGAVQVVQTVIEPRIEQDLVPVRETYVRRQRKVDFAAVEFHRLRHSLRHRSEVALPRGRRCRRQFLPLAVARCKAPRRQCDEQYAQDDFQCCGFDFASPIFHNVLTQFDVYALVFGDYRPCFVNFVSVAR